MSLNDHINADTSHKTRERELPSIDLVSIENIIKNSVSQEFPLTFHHDIPNTGNDVHHQNLDIPNGNKRDVNNIMQPLGRLIQDSKEEESRTSDDKKIEENESARNRDDNRRFVNNSSDSGSVHDRNPSIQFYDNKTDHPIINEVSTVHYSAYA